MAPRYLNDLNRTLIHAKEVESKLDDVVQAILMRNANFIRHHSGMVLEDILALLLKGVEYLPLKCRAYRKLPEFLANKEAIINLKNQDKRCFGFTLLSALNRLSYKQHSNRPGHYFQLLEQYGLDAIHYPVAFQDIPRREDNIGVTINVFCFFDDKGENRHPLCLGEGL